MTHNCSIPYSLPIPYRVHPCPLPQTRPLPQTVDSIRLRGTLVEHDSTLMTTKEHTQPQQRDIPKEVNKFAGKKINLVPSTETAAQHDADMSTEGRTHTPHPNPKDIGGGVQNKRENESNSQPSSTVPQKPARFGRRTGGVGESRDKVRMACEFCGVAVDIEKMEEHIHNIHQQEVLKKKEEEKRRKEDEQTQIKMREEERRQKEEEERKRKGEQAQSEKDEEITRALNAVPNTTVIHFPNHLDNGTSNIEERIEKRPVTDVHGISRHAPVSDAGAHRMCPLCGEHIEEAGYVLHVLTTCPHARSS
ncbi:hypothetical protein BLNAU_17949 [Blattamonas nauphoetae]|uniref:C2H2-type domain-containing protein n=1 Tax=Blattamonas nauphoetae TaxID=2049346 RepID=A0ABQ9X8T6_9EUKA|nr:hypothetical protein BLNAU_17949 [Blattamonas nauphoetae]